MLVVIVDAVAQYPAAGRIGIKEAGGEVDAVVAIIRRCSAASEGFPLILLF